MTKNKKKFSIILLIVIIVAELFYTTYVFAFEKEGVQSDEIWSYGLANSYYKPFIYMKDGVRCNDERLFGENKEECLDNINTWISGDTLKDYITVSEDEKFSFGSVYHNQTLDNHPPLYYWMLNTVCSLFPGKFSFWYGFFLSCIFLVFTQIYLYKLSLLVTKGNKPYMALLVCVLYGAGLGALTTFIYIRMYSFVTAMIVIHLYYQFRLMSSQDFNIKKCILPVIITGFIGMFADNVFIVMMGICTFCICVWLLCKKKIKKMFIYGFSMLGTLGAYFLAFPAAITQLFSFNTHDSQTKLSMVEQGKRLLSYVTSQNLGFSISVFKTSTSSYIFAVVVLLLAVLIPLCFLFRNESWFLKIKNNVVSKAKKIASHFNKNDIKKFFNGINWYLVFISAVIIGYCLVSGATVNVMSMGRFSSRYVMPLFPLACLVCAGIIQYIFSWIIPHIPKISKLTPVFSAVVVLIMIVRSNVCYGNVYLNKQPENYQPLEEPLAGQKCEVLMKSPWLSVCYSHLLMNCSEVKYAMESNLIDENKNANLDGIEKGETMYLIIPGSESDNQKAYSSDSQATLTLDNTDSQLMMSLFSDQTLKYSNEEIEDFIKKNPKVNSLEKMYNILIQGGVCTLYKIN